MNPMAVIPGALVKLGAPVQMPAVSAAVENNSIEANRRTARNSHFWMGEPGLWRRLILTDDAKRIRDAHKAVFDLHGYQVDPDYSLTAFQSNQLWSSILVPPPPSRALAQPA